MRITNRLTTLLESTEIKKHIFVMRLIWFLQKIVFIF